MLLQEVVVILCYMLDFTDVTNVCNIFALLFRFGVSVFLSVQANCKCLWPISGSGIFTLNMLFICLFTVLAIHSFVVCLFYVNNIIMMEVDTNQWTKSSRSTTFHRILSPAVYLESLQCRTETQAHQTKAGLFSMLSMFLSLHNVKY